MYSQSNRGKRRFETIMELRHRLLLVMNLNCESVIERYISSSSLVVDSLADALRTPSAYKMLAGELHHTKCVN